MESAEHLGPVEVWQIREFPRGLRQYVADEARKENVKVGEWLTKVVLAYRAGDIPKPVFANLSTGAADPLDRAIDRACRLAEHAGAMPKGVAALAYGLVKAELRALKVEQSNGVLKPRLTHQPATAPGSDDVTHSA